MSKLIKLYKGAPVVFRDMWLAVLFVVILVAQLVVLTYIGH